MSYCNIYPTPNYMVGSDEKFYFSEISILRSPKLIQTAKELYEELFGLFTRGVAKISVQERDDDEHLLLLGNPSLASIKKEFDHFIHIDNGGVAIWAKDRKNLCYAFTYFTQMIVVEGKLKVEKAYVFCGDYACKCDTPIRAAHIVIGARDNAFQHLRSRILALGYMKYTHIIIESFGMIRFDSLPEYSYPQAFSKADWKKLVEIANAVGLEVIPFFNSGGHACLCAEGNGGHVLLGPHPEYAPLFEPDGWTWCYSNPETIRILKGIYNELLEICGEGKYFHIGMDETRSIGTCPLCAKKDKGEIFVSFVNEIAKEMREKGRRVMIWGDELLYFEEFPEPLWSATSFKTPNIKGSNHDVAHAIDQLDKNVIICDWQYRPTEGENLTAQHFKKHGFEVWQAAYAVPYANYKWHLETAKKDGNSVMMTGFNSDLYQVWNYIMGAQWYYTGTDIVPSVASSFLRIARIIAPELAKDGLHAWM